MDQRSERDAGRRREHDRARLRQIEVATGHRGQPRCGLRDQGRGHGTRRSSEPAAQQPGTGPPPATARRGRRDCSARRRGAAKGRTPTPYEEFENPEFKDLSDEQTARILRAVATIVGNCERRVEALAREHNINVELGVPAEGWSPPADVREELEERAARNVPLRSRVREPAEASDRAEGVADRRSPDRNVGDGTPGDDDRAGRGGR